MAAVIFNGARNPEGQTARAAGAMAEGLQAAGLAVEQVFLPAQRLERCRQCENDGWGTCKTAGACVIEDDFAKLFAKLRAAEAAVVISPVYYGDLSESMRAFLDRLRRMTWHVAENRAGVEGKKVVGICVAGGGGGGGLTCAVQMEKILGTCRVDLVDMVLVRRQNLALKLEVLRQTGRWLGQQVVAQV